MVFKMSSLVIVYTILDLYDYSSNKIHFYDVYSSFSLIFYADSPCFTYEIKKVFEWTHVSQSFQCGFHKIYRNTFIPFINYRNLYLRPRMHSYTYLS